MTDRDAAGRHQPGAVSVARAAASWLGSNRMGLVVMALVVGAGAGLGAAGFRELIFFVTWLATGHTQFGQQGHAPSLHLAFLGIWFVLVVPVVGGLLYGPLIQRFAREARGHGVPEVMLAVAENGGRIRPPVTIVKALASAITIGTGGSVGREGPIVQIGSALASTLGQWVRMSEHRLRIIVACGAAGGIAATFNAPITGLFFGFEIVLREFSLDALFTTSLAAVTGDIISRAFFGSAPFFASIPHDLAITNDGSYLLVAVLALGVGVDRAGLQDRALRHGGSRRCAVARTARMGAPRGRRRAPGTAAARSAPDVRRRLSGHGLGDRRPRRRSGSILLFLVGKIVAASLTLSIGGSGGVFAPSLFIGAMAGMAFGIGAHHLFGPAVGPPALYAVVAMGGVFAGAAQAPLTAIASVVEMTGNFTLTLPIMLASGIAAALSKQLSYGSVYTTKLLRRGIDIERPRPRQRPRDAQRRRRHAAGPDRQRPAPPRRPASAGADRPGRRARMQLEQLGCRGPAPPRTRRSCSRTKRWSRRCASSHCTGAPACPSSPGTASTCAAGSPAAMSCARSPRASRTPARCRGWSRRRGLRGRRPRIGRASVQRAARGYEIVELSITPGSLAAGRRIGEVPWPAGAMVVAVTEAGEMTPALPTTTIRAGERVVLLAPVHTNGRPPGRSQRHHRQLRDEP